MQTVDYKKYFFLLLTSSTVFSTALLNFFIIILIIIFLFFSIKKKDFLEFACQKNFLFIWFFCFYLIFQSLILNDINPITYRSILGFFKNVLFFFAFIYFFKIKDLNLLFNFYLFIIFFVSIDIVFQYSLGFNLLGYSMSDYTGDKNRISSFFAEELVAGSYLSKVIFIPLICYVQKEGSKNFKTLCLSIFLFAVFSITLTGDRMAILNTLFFTIIIFSIFFKFRYLMLMFICTFLILFSQKNLIERNLHNTVDQIAIVKNDLKGNKINSIYLNHYLSSLKLFENSPIYGNGIRSFRYKCSEVANSKYTVFDKSYHLGNGCSTHPHNYYLEIISSTGIIGFILVLLFIFKILIYRLKLNSKKHLILLLTALIILNPIQTTGSFFASWNSFFIWQILGVFYIFKRV